MNSIAGHHHGHLKIAEHVWKFAIVIVALILAGAVGSLLAGLAAPDVIGADGLARATMTMR